MIWTPRESKPEARLALMLSLILWLASSSVITIGAIFAGQMRSPSEYLSVPFTVCTAAAITMLLYRPVRMLQGRSAIVAFPFVLGAIVVAAALQTAVDYGMHAVFVRIFPGHVMPSMDVVSLTVVGAIYFSLYACNAALLWLSFVSQISRERELALARTTLDLTVSEMRSTQAQLRMLRLQLDPHFMMNSLGAISTLAMSGDAAGASDMADKLADFLRLLLEKSDGIEHGLGEELALMEAYLDVEEVRFGDRLTVELDCPVDLALAQVPNFIIQPLVENAMKHGFARAVGGMTLMISARERAGDLCITVEDRMGGQRPGSTPASSGIGLANTRERLEALYGSQGVLTTTLQPKGFHAEIRLPLRVATSRGDAAS